MQPPELSSNVINLWFHYEQVAMHFNELIIEYRLHLMSAIGGIGAFSGYLISGKVHSRLMRSELTVLVSTILIIVFLAAAMLDLCYYDKLLQGSIDALVQFEASHPPINMSTLIAKTVPNKGLIPIKLAYSLILFSLLLFNGWSWCTYFRERKSAKSGG